MNFVTLSLVRPATSTFMLLAILATAAFAQDSSVLVLPGEIIELNGRQAFLFLPSKEKQSHPQPWVMYGATLIGKYPDVHEKWMHEQFLDAGIAVAGIDVGEAYGSPTGQKGFDALYEELTSKRNFAKRPCLLGRSRGGLWVSSWATRNVKRVAGLSGIYPCFDLRTYPGLKRAAPAYNMTPEQLESQLMEHNPIERVTRLAEARIPALFIHGVLDRVVPLQENSSEFASRYKKAGVAKLVTVIEIDGQGHNFWPGFFHCQELVDFTIRQARIGAGSR